MRKHGPPPTPEENILLRLLRDEPLAGALERCSKEELFKQAVKHKVLAPLAVRLEGEAAVEPSWRRWALFASMSSERDARLWSGGAEKTVKLLESSAISPVMLKGPSLALGRPRDMGDIDLLVPRDSLVKAISVLEAEGYEYKGFERNMYIRRNEYRDWDKLARWSNQFEFREPETGALIELHTAFFETERVYREDLSRFREAVDEFIAHRVKDPETGYFFLSLEDRILLLALHAGLKRSPANHSFILRHLFDFKHLAAEGPDWDRLEQRAFRFGGAHHLLFLLRLYEAFAPPCVPEGFIGRIESKLSRPVAGLQNIHLRCLSGLDSYNRRSVFTYQLLLPYVLKGTPRALVQSLLVFPLLFPSIIRLSRYYGLPQRSRLAFLLYLLEPLRWTLRIFRKIAKGGRERQPRPQARP